MSAFPVVFSSSDTFFYASDNASRGTLEDDAFQRVASLRDALLSESQPLISLAEQLKALRLSRGITRSQWAALSGVSRMTLWRWETGVSQPHLYELDQALLALSVRPEEYSNAYALRNELSRNRK